MLEGHTQPQPQSVTNVSWVRNESSAGDVDGVVRSPPLKEWWVVLFWQQQKQQQLQSGNLDGPS